MNNVILFSGHKTLFIHIPIPLMRPSVIYVLFGSNVTTTEVWLFMLYKPNGNRGGIKMTSTWCCQQDTLYEVNLGNRIN